MTNIKDLNRTQKLTELNTALDWVGMSNAFWMEGDNSAYWNVSLQGGGSSRELQNEISYLKRAKQELEKDLALERGRATMTESEKLKSLRTEIDEKKKRVTDLETSVTDLVKVWDKSKQALTDIHFVLGTSSLQEVVVAMEGKSLKELAKRAKEGKSASEDWSDISMQFNRPEVKKAWTDLGITYKDAYVWIRGGLLNYNQHQFVAWATRTKKPPIDAFEYIRAFPEEQKKWWTESKLIEVSKPYVQTGRIVINNSSSHFFTDKGGADRSLTLNLSSPIEYAGFDERLAYFEDEKWKKPQQLVIWYIDTDTKNLKDIFDQLKAKVPSGKKISKLTLNITQILDDRKNLNIEYSPPITGYPFASINVRGEILVPITATDLVLVDDVPPAGWQLWQYKNPIFNSKDKVDAWEKKGFNFERADGWIRVGHLTVDESAFAQWLVNKGGNYAKPEWIATNKGTVEPQYKLEAEEAGSITLINGFGDVKYDNGTKTITLIYNGSALDSLTLIGIKAKQKVTDEQLKGTKQLAINLTGDDVRYERLRNKFLLAPLMVETKIELVKGSTVSVSGENFVITKDSFEDGGVKVTQKSVASYLNKLYIDLQPYLKTGSGVGGNDAEWELVKKLLAEYTADEVKPSVKVVIARLDAEKASYTTAGKFDEIRKRLNDLIGVGSTERTWENLTTPIVPDLKTDPSTSEVPPLAMSAQGVTDTYADANLPPRGSCIMTSSGDLNLEGITQIVNPLSGSNSDNAKRPSVASLIKSIQNTIILTERLGKPSIAFPLIGGALFIDSFTDLTGTKDAKQQELAEAIIISAIKQRTGNTLILKFLDHDGNAFQKAWEKIKSDAKYTGKTNNVTVLPTDTEGVGAKSGITRFAFHNCRVIANAPNLECKISSGSGVVEAIRNTVGVLHVPNVDKEASDTIRDYWLRYKKLSGDDTPPLALEGKKTEFIDKIEAILATHSTGIDDAVNKFNKKGVEAGHWGSDARGKTWKNYIGNVTRDDINVSDADNNLKDVKFAINQTLTEFMIDEHIAKGNKVNLQKFVDAFREPEAVGIYVRDDYKTKLNTVGIKVFVEVTDWGNVLGQLDEYLTPKKTGSFEDVKKWVLEKRWPDPLADINLQGVDLVTLRKLKAGTSHTYLNTHAAKLAGHWKEYTSLATEMDGNCFLNAFAVLLTGKDDSASQKATALKLRTALCLELMTNGENYFGDVEGMNKRMINSVGDSTKIPEKDKMVTTMTKDGQWLSTEDIIYFTKILKRPIYAVFNDEMLIDSMKNPETGGIVSFSYGIQNQKGIYYRYQPFVIYNSDARHFEALVHNEVHNEGYIEFACKNATFVDEKNEADGHSILLETQGSAGKFGFSTLEDKRLTDGAWNDWRAIRIWYNGKDDRVTKDKNFKNVKDMFTDGHGVFDKKSDSFVIEVVNASDIRFDDKEIHLSYNSYSGIHFLNK